MTYASFLESKSQLGGAYGFAPTFLPSAAFPFQSALIDWATRKGRGAIFADCGLGKTLMQLTWAENVVRKTNRPVLLLTPLAVAHQTITEAAKFNIQATRSSGPVKPGINVANYQRLHHFNPEDFAGLVLDESSILKSFDGATKNAVTEFMRRLPYRLLCTATAAPNDYTELGTSSEALGELGLVDVLNRFFKNDHNSIDQGRKFGEVVTWRFKGHAQQPFWRWVCSWARALRCPSEMGFDDDGFVLPELRQIESLVHARSYASGMLFNLPATGLREQREERRRTLVERCEHVASLVNDSGDFAVVWCHLNQEGDLLERLIPDAIQVSGRDSDDAKEEKLTTFSDKGVRVLITKPSIGAWGLNLQHCAHVVFFPSHSYEQYYQAVRRCWRFGQRRPVRVDIVMTEGDRAVMQNMQRKAVKADEMFTALLSCMHEAQSIGRSRAPGQAETVPSWL